MKEGIEIGIGLIGDKIAFGLLDPYEEWIVFDGADDTLVGDWKKGVELL